MTELQAGDMVPAFIHIPTKKLNGEKSFRAAIAFEQQLLERLGGYTIAGSASGVWRNADGVVYHDSHTIYSVSIHHGDGPAALKPLVAELAHGIHELCIFVLIGGERSRSVFWWAEDRLIGASGGRRSRIDEDSRRQPSLDQLAVAAGIARAETIGAFR